MHTRVLTVCSRNMHVREKERKQETSVACSTTQIYYYSHSPIGKRPTRTVFYFLYMHVTQSYDMHILMCAKIEFPKIFCPNLLFVIDVVRSYVLDRFGTCTEFT